MTNQIDERAQAVSEESQYSKVNWTRCERNRMEVLLGASMQLHPSQINSAYLCMRRLMRLVVDRSHGCGKMIVVKFRVD